MFGCFRVVFGVSALGSTQIDDILILPPLKMFTNIVINFYLPWNSFGCLLFLQEIMFNLFCLSICLFVFFSILKGLSKHSLAVKLQVGLSVLSIAISVWLGYANYIVLQNVCIICATLQIINIVIVTLTIIRYKQLRQKQPTTSTGTTKKKAPAKKGKSKKDQ